MPIPKKKPITKREIENYDVTVDSEDVAKKSNEAKKDYFDDKKQNTHPTSSIDEFEDDEDLFADLYLDDIDGFDDDLDKQVEIKSKDTSEKKTKENIPEEKIAKKAEVRDNKPAQSQSIVKPKNPVYDFYGYKITSLTEKEANVVRKFRLNEEIVSNYCLAKLVAYDYFQDYRDDFIFNKQWGFPCSGNYIGYIMKCTPNYKRNKEYIVDFLANDYDVCLFKFTTSFRDAVNIGIKRDLGWSSTIFSEPDYTCLRCLLVCISVENITLDSGSVYSKITNFKVMYDDEVEIINKLIDDMKRR